MKKCMFLICMTLTISSATVNAAHVPTEIVPDNATADEIIIAENLACDIFDSVQNGMGYADAKNKVNSRIFQAVIKSV